MGDGAIAQSVEQWTENPCVVGSIPAHTTIIRRSIGEGEIIKASQECEAFFLWLVFLPTTLMLPQMG